MKKTQCSIDRTLSNLLHKSHCKSNIQYYIYSKVGFTKNKKEVYKVSMFINEIKELKLIFPISVEIGVSHIATAKIGSNEFYGEGKTVEEAIENLKTAIYDMHHSLCSDDNVMYTKQGKATKEKFLSSFKQCAKNAPTGCISKKRAHKPVEFDGINYFHCGNG